MGFVCQTSGADVFPQTIFVTVPQTSKLTPKNLLLKNYFHLDGFLTTSELKYNVNQGSLERSVLTNSTTPTTL